MRKENEILAAAPCHRVTLSPHEWDWTHDEQVAMAREVLRLRDERKSAIPLLRALRVHPGRSCHFYVLAGEILLAYGEPLDGNPPINQGH